MQPAMNCYLVSFIKLSLSGLLIGILPNPQLDHAFSISCIPAGGGTIDKYLWGRESVNDPPINFTEVPPDSHFMQANNRLGFTGVENSDDGLYVCYVKRQGQPTFSERKEAGCIYVLGELVTQLIYVLHNLHSMVQ